MSEHEKFEHALAKMIVADRYALTDFEGLGSTQKSLQFGSYMAYPNRKKFSQRKPRRFASEGQAQAYLSSL